MGFQIYHGLGTSPGTEWQSFHPGEAPYISTENLFSPCKLYGGARSSRSQFRGETSGEATDGKYGSLGVGVDMPPLGVSEAATAANERGSAAGYMNVVGMNFSKIKKRTLRRAIKRAENRGTSNYKGKQLHSTVLPVSVRRPPCAGRLKQRVGILSWNCSGLTQLLFAEVQVYLKQHPEIHIVILQETHRAHLHEWQDGGWTFVSSPCAKPKSGGILLGVRHDFCERDTLRWQELIPGRLLQARCFAQGQHLDILAVYQHTLPFGAAELKKVLQSRRVLWNKLDDALRSLPVRSSIIVAGDLNSGLESSSPCTGGGIIPHNQAAEVVAERKWLSGVFQGHQLCALNTWSRKASSHTFFHSRGKSQIDFILVRSVLADAIAKWCVSKAAPIAGWRSSGHLLLQAAVPLKWEPWKLGGGARKCADPSFGECTPLRSLRHDVARAYTAPANPLQRPGLRGLDGEIVRFWEARKQLTSQRVRTLRDAFHRLRLLQQLRRHHRELRSMARARKRRQLLEILELAETAASRGDSKGLFQCVRWLAPRKAQRSIRLRDSAGNVMHPRAECKLLVDYAKELFKARRPEHLCSPVLQPLPRIMFQPSAWCEAISSMRSGKAVPNGEPPVQAWKEDIGQAAQRLACIAQEALCGRDLRVPPEWTWVQLAWLAKAGKSPNCPENLRSIGLMPADAKAFLIILREAIAPIVRASLQSTPQYAYRQGTSTADPLLRATLHCAAVRDLLKQHQRDHTTKLLGAADVPLIGGLMLSLDLRKAFDAVPHPEILSSLLEAGVDESLAVLLTSVHAQTRCVILHGGSAETTLMSRGLRQGCPVAPIIFAAWTARLHRKIRDALGVLGRRLRSDCYSMFADDLHAHWLLRDPAGFTAALEEIRLLIEILEDLGMAVNFQKSLVVLRLRGSAVAKACRAVAASTFAFGRALLAAYFHRHAIPGGCSII
eukprot:s150_g17.t1